MKRVSSRNLQSYVAFCPSCGRKLRFEPSTKIEDMEAIQGVCSPVSGHSACGKKWSFVFDIDPSGTFGVMSFQCDNEDRIM